MRDGSPDSKEEEAGSRSSWSTASNVGSVVLSHEDVTFRRWLRQ